MSDFTMTVLNLPAHLARMQGAGRVIKDEAIAAVDRCTRLGQDWSRRLVHSRSEDLVTSVEQRRATFAGMTARGSWGTTLPYARFVEEGRGPIRAKRGKALRFEIDGVVLFRRSVGPAAPRPFISRAFKELRGRFNDEFRIARARIVARLGGRS